MGTICFKCRKLASQIVEVAQMEKTADFIVQFFANPAEGKLKLLKTTEKAPLKAVFKRPFSKNSKFKLPITKFKAAF